MTTDFPTASLGSSQAPTDAVEKSPSASNTKIQTLPCARLRPACLARGRARLQAARPVRCAYLPDADDVHVLAAAIGGHADCIVTWNLKDFPSDVLEVHGIEAVDPDSFIIAQWDLDTVAAIEAFKRMRGRWRSPSASPEGVVSENGK